MSVTHDAGLRRRLLLYGRRQWLAQRWVLPVAPGIGAAPLFINGGGFQNRVGDSESGSQGGDGLLRLVAVWDVPSINRSGSMRIRR